MTADRNTPVSLGMATVAVACVVVFTLGWMVAAARMQGIWIDEIWSLWMSQRDLPLAGAFTQRWAQDVHPMYFHALNWLLEPYVGMDLFVRRLLNLIPLTYFLFVATSLSLAYPRVRKFSLVFVTLVVASHYSIHSFAEHRSYFSGLCFTGALMICLRVLVGQDHDLDLRRDLGLALLLFFSAACALIIHYVGTIIVGSVVGVAFLAQLRLKRPGWAALFVLAGLLALSLLITSLWAESAYLKATAPNFWVKTGPISAALIIVAIVGFSAVENILAYGVAGLVLFAAVRRARGGDDRKVLGLTVTLPSQDGWAYVVLVAIALGVASAALFAVNELKPIVINRYLIPLTPITAALIAAVAAEQVLAHRWIFAAFIANAAVIAAVEAHAPLHNPRWEATATLVAADLKACPTSPVYAIKPNFFSPYTGPPNQPEIQIWGYHQVAATHQFSVRLLDPTKPQAIAFDSHCPTLLWGEHINPQIGPVKLVTAPFSKVLPAGVTLKDADIVRGETGFIITLHAPQAAGAPLRAHS